MEMYGVARSEVLETIAGAGGELVGELTDSTAGPEWTSYLYFVTKHSGREIQS